MKRRMKELVYKRKRNKLIELKDILNIMDEAYGLDELIRTTFADVDIDKLTVSELIDKILEEMLSMS